ncbi:hypothetical protein EBI_26291, partial [Enterocytozoon bieneusi H348]
KGGVYYIIPPNNGCFLFFFHTSFLLNPENFFYSGLRRKNFFPLFLFPTPKLCFPRPKQTLFFFLWPQAQGFFFIFFQKRGSRVYLNFWPFKNSRHPIRIKLG